MPPVASRPLYRQPDLHRLFEPRSIALVGASPREGVARLVLSNLQHFGGRVHLVNANYREVMGLACHPSLAALPEVPDCVICAVGRDSVEQVITDGAALGVGGAVVFASGFAETGQAQRAQDQARLVDTASRGGLRILGPNAVGFITHRARLAASFTPELALSDAAGPAIGLVSQSGGVGNGLTQALHRGIAFSHTLSPGNSSDVDCADCIAFLATAPDCQAIAVVLEGLESPPRLVEAARLAWEQDKPLVIFKLGRGQQGAKAALSHSGFVTGSAEAFDAVMRSVGAIVVDRLGALVETAAFLAKAPPAVPGAQGVAIISASGGTVVHAADEAERHGVPLPPLPDALAERIAALVPDFANVANPLDLTSSPNGPQRLLDCATEILADPSYAALVAPHVYTFGAELRKFDELGQIAERAGKPILVNWISEWVEGPGAAQGHRNPRLAVFRSTGDAFAAVHAWLRRSRDRALPAVSQPRLSPTTAPGEAARILDAAAGRSLSEREAQEVLHRYGIPVAGGRLARDADEAARIARAFGVPVAVKVESPDLLHKTDADAVRLDCRTEAQVRTAFEQVMANARTASPQARLHGALIQPMAPAGAEILVGGRIDRQFGPLVLAGVGGAMVELVRDAAVAPAPLSTRDALGLLGRIRGQALLNGFRGAPAVDREALADIIVRVSELLADQQQRIREIDINPLICRGASIVAVDALIATATPASHEPH